VTKSHSGFSSPTFVAGLFDFSSSFGFDHELQNAELSGNDIQKFSVWQSTQSSFGSTVFQGSSPHTSEARLPHVSLTSYAGLSRTRLWFCKFVGRRSRSNACISSSLQRSEVSWNLLKSCVRCSNSALNRSVIGESPSPAKRSKTELASANLSSCGNTRRLEERCQSAEFVRKKDV
jgi:hypothetical protein